jgi:RNA polymerase sigma factor (sigma-70 family)
VLITPAAGFSQFADSPVYQVECEEQVPAAASERDVEELRRQIVSVALRVLRRQQDAEDIAHDALLKLLTAQSNGSTVIDQRAFATRTAVRLAIDRLRCAHRQSTKLPEIARLRAVSAAADEARPPPDVRRLYDAIATLPAKQAAVVTLRKLMQLEYEDIAGILGISQENCRSHLKLALQRLRQTLTDRRSIEP